MYWLTSIHRQWSNSEGLRANLICFVINWLVRVWINRIVSLIVASFTRYPLHVSSKCTTAIITTYLVWSQQIHDFTVSNGMRTLMIFGQPTLSNQSMHFLHREFFPMTTSSTQVTCSGCYPYLNKTSLEELFHSSRDGKLWFQSGTNKIKWSEVIRIIFYS